MYQQRVCYKDNKSHEDKTNQANITGRVIEGAQQHKDVGMGPGQRNKEGLPEMLSSVDHGNSNHSNKVTVALILILMSSSGQRFLEK